jgi:phosphate uptake regulator
MKRKLVKHGPSTLITSLPANWVKKMGLKSGDEIDVEEEGNKLIIKTEKKDQFSSATIDLSKKKFLKRFINIIYNLGYDEIIIKNSSSKIISEIKSSLDELMGFEIVDQSISSITIRAVAQSSEDLDVIIKRIFFITSSMGKEIEKMTYSGKTNMIKEVICLEEMQNRLCHFACRNLNKLGYKNEKLSCYSYFIVEQLEQIGDQYKMMIKSVKPEDYDKKTRRILLLIVEYFDLILRQFSALVIEDLPSLKEKRKKIEYEIENTKSKDKLFYVYCILSLMKHVETSLMYNWK